MKPKAKAVYAKFSYFTGRKRILNLSSTHVRALHAAVTSGQLHTTSSGPPLGFRYPAWLMTSFSFIPAPTGFDPKYSARLFSGLFSPSEVF